MSTNILSSLFSLNQNDIIKGIIVASLAAFLGGVQQALSAHGLDFGLWDWNLILNLALSSGLAYISKQFITDEEGKINTPLGKLG